MGRERDSLEGRRGVCAVGLEEGDRGPESKTRNVRSRAALGAWDALCLPLGAGESHDVDSSRFPPDVTIPPPPPSRGVSLTHQGRGCRRVGWSIRTGGGGEQLPPHGPRVTGHRCQQRCGCELRPLPAGCPWEGGREEGGAGLRSPKQ